MYETEVSGKHQQIKHLILIFNFPSKTTLPIFFWGGGNGVNPKDSEGRYQRMQLWAERNKWQYTCHFWKSQIAMALNIRTSLAYTWVLTGSQPYDTSGSGLETLAEWRINESHVTSWPCSTTPMHTTDGRVLPLPHHGQTLEVLARDGETDFHHAQLMMCTGP